MAEPVTESGSWILPDKLWMRTEKLLPKYKTTPLGGRHIADLRKVAKWNFLRPSNRLLAECGAK